MWTRLRKWLNLVYRSVQVLFEPRRPSRGASHLIQMWRIEHASCGSEPYQDLFVQRDFPVEVIFCQARKVLAFLGVVRVEFGHGRVENCFAT